MSQILGANLFAHLHLTDLYQDTKGCEVDGVVYPPTFDWHGQLTCMRADKQSFYVDLVIPNKVISDHRAIIAYIQNALLSLQSYVNEVKV